MKRRGKERENMDLVKRIKVLKERIQKMLK
jgi:hypothetical protein